jgi:tellurium resistance protein TerZ
LLNLQHIPPNVLAYYLILSVHTPNYTLAQMQSAKVRFYSTDHRTGEEQSICVISPTQSDLGQHTSLIVARIAREQHNNNGQDWKLQPIEAGMSPARDFGTLLPQIKSYTRDLLPSIHIDPNERVAILQKSGVIKIQDFCPSQVIPTTVSFGLAWDVTNGVSIDLDGSVICLDSDLVQVDVVYFGKLKSTDGSILHTGDQRSGSAAGDDETINILLEGVNPRTKYIGIIINSYSGQELDDVARASCRLYDTETRAEIARYTLTDAKPLDKHTALVVGCLYRGNQGAWLLTIISEPAQGRTVADNLDELQNWLRRNPPPMNPTIQVEPVTSDDIHMSTMPAFVPL